MREGSFYYHRSEYRFIVVEGRLTLLDEYGIVTNWELYHLPGVTCIKDWSEYQGLMRALHKAGVVKFLFWVPSGMGRGAVCEVIE